VLVVELLLYLVITAVVAAGLGYLFTRDRRYLRFVVQLVKFMIMVLAGVALFFLLEQIIIRL
jgi:ABC-type proline/glycine betaine transport system permease subunit